MCGISPPRANLDVKSSSCARLDIQLRFRAPTWVPTWAKLEAEVGAQIGPKSQLEVDLRTAKSKSRQHYVQQVELQAVALFKLDHDLEERGARQSTVWLVAAVGPIYVVAIVTREQIEAAYPDANLAYVNRRIQLLEQEEEMARAHDVLSASPDAMLAEFSTFPEEQYTTGCSKLPTSEVNRWKNIQHWAS
ncbi:hypothetical protein B0H13DRAFT_1888315 [Mycena leptocephala]|nr:hypothetical protein B0H13DRAFT_1888315 [Mycena leptocephala]